MSSAPAKSSGTPARPGGGIPAGGTPTIMNPQTILRDKLHGRTSTPDSEALVSSDDEVDPHHRPEALPPAPAQKEKSMRRPSWLSETTPILTNPRRGSLAGNQISPTTSHPAAPTTEGGAAQSSWAANVGGSMNRQPTTSAFQWSSSIWSTDNKKEPPARLTEVLPSPTSAIPPASAGPGSGTYLGNETMAAHATSPSSRETGPIPFSIPLYPTPKTYRSQSYSVGQIDPELATPPSATSAIHMMSRQRHPGLHHRPSRPSMLSEMSEGGGLGKVKEVDDDDEDGPAPLSNESRIEMLTRENAMLRQQQQQQQQQQQLQQQLHNNNTGRMRQRAIGQPSYLASSYGGLRGSLYEDDELDESGDAAGFLDGHGTPRRASEFGPSMLRGYVPENRKLENVKRGAWTTSPLFTGLENLPQSRRHSLADAPIRQPSLSSLVESAGGLDSASVDPHQQDFAGSYNESAFAVGSPTTAAYFTPSSGFSAPTQQPLVANQSLVANQYMAPVPHHGNNPYAANRPPSPQRGMFGLQPRHSQLLYIVLFKCVRADVFYIQEGTGLTVKKGDLVIVEADRGTDLGTVAEDNLTWNEAKERKEHYAEEHYKWLMMYSHSASASAESMESSNIFPGSTVGGMGPAQSQHHGQEPNAGELKPKLIKRLAQPHEIHALREKEGNEAKAKRTCMQKVKEHNLNMEILDAEYQMDWKKLTFYYFADSYINFNSLVTDLFKIYKTRIWMSAINPASFASPTLGIQAPSGVGIGAVGVRVPGSGERRQSTQQQQKQHSQPQQVQQQIQQQIQQQAQPQQPPATALLEPQQLAAYAPAGMVRSFQHPSAPVFTHPFTAPERSLHPVAATAAAFVPGGYQYPQYTPMNLPRASNMTYAPQPVVGMPAGFDYSAGRRFPTSPSGAVRTTGLNPDAPAQPEWVNSFHGLSLNTP